MRFLHLMENVKYALLSLGQWNLDFPAAQMNAPERKFFKLTVLVNQTSVKKGP